MPSIKAAILGFGTVGEGVYRILQEKREQIKRETGYTIDVVSVLVSNTEKERSFTPHAFLTDSIDEIVENQDIDIVFEALVGEEPAYEYLSKAIENRCHVITANKKMFAKHGPALLKHAEFRGVTIGFEATTAGGIPLIRTIHNLLKADRVKYVAGILNGTSNYILTKMREERVTFAQALRSAQEKGFAEADPADDIGGMDAFYKLMILSGLAFGSQPEWEDVHVEGIDHLSPADIEEAAENELRFRHIAKIAKDAQGCLSGSVGSVLLDTEDPLYSIDGVDNAIIIETEYLGRLTLTGPGAGMYPTGSAMVADAVHLLAGIHKDQLVTQ